MQPPQNLYTVSSQFSLGLVSLLFTAIYTRQTITSFLHHHTPLWMSFIHTSLVVTLCLELYFSDCLYPYPVASRGCCLCVYLCFSLESREPDRFFVLKRKRSGMGDQAGLPVPTYNILNRHCILNGASLNRTPPREKESSLKQGLYC